MNMFYNLEVVITLNPPNAMTLQPASTSIREVLKMNNAQRFCLKPEILTVRGETTRVLAFNNGSRVRVSLFLAIADIF